MKNKICIHKIFMAAQIALMIVWVSNLAATDAYISVYTLLGFAGFYCCLKAKDRCVVVKRSHSIVLGISSVILAALVVFANYELFTKLGDPAVIQASTSKLVNLINLGLTFLGGCCVFHPIVLYLYHWLPVSSGLPPRSDRDKAFRNFAVFSFLIMAAAHLIHLFLVEYPGNVTEDPFTQIGEMVSGTYSNFNTYWHTILMQSILSLGYSIFGDVNDAVAMYSGIQALLLVGAFAFCLNTLYIAGIPRGYLLVVFLIYTILPYNLALSITIWKDVLFGAGCLYLCSALFRLIKGIGTRPVLNYGLLILGCLLFCISRTNGWMILGVTAVLMALAVRRQGRALAVLFAASVLFWALNGPLLAPLGVSSGEFSESLSIPLQQVSRVIVEGKELTLEEQELISQVLDLEEVPELYTNWISDPIKVEFRSNNVAFFEENYDQYVKLWFRLGLRYPGSYFRAWVDQTKGYWNGGYDVALYGETVTDNPYGVEKSGGIGIIASLFRLYFGLSRHVIFFQPLHSIGLHAWAAAILCLINLLKKRKEWLLAVPPLIVVLAMCFGTPVYYCFRYVYLLFITFPLILGTTLHAVPEKA